MATRKTRKRQTVEKPKKYRFVISCFLLGISIAVLVFSVGYLIKTRYLKPIEPVISDDDPVEADVIDEPVEITKSVPSVDLQPIVDAWVKQVGGNKSVIIYDLDNEKTVGVYNPDEKYNTASLYKLFVVYEGYRRLQNGEWQQNTKAGSTGHTILECLDLAIRESHSSCAETLWSMIGHDNLDRIIKNDLKIQNSDISHLTSNPNDILKIMQLFYKHDDIKDETLVSRMEDSFLNQPATTYNWRQGLPSGFKKAAVYNKVGWDYNPSKKYWNIYHDTAIIDFGTDKPHLIVVVMTNKVPFERISALGTEIEKAVLNS